MSNSGEGPAFLIVGAMRSGTTSLHHWLRHHPDVFMPAAKELHYFDVHYDRGPSWYHQHFAAAGPHHLVGEATPEYLFLPWARQRLSRDVPESRLVVTLRNPVDRAWSHYSMLKARGREDLGFEEALDAEARRLRDPASWSRYGYVQKGHYAEQLEDLFTRHGRDKVLVLLFERDIVSRPTSTFERLCSFIGAGAPGEASSATVGTTVNAAVRIRSTSIRRAAQRLPKPARDLVGRFNTAHAPANELPLDLRQRLHEALDPSTRQLETLLGLDLSDWQSAQSSKRQERS